MIQIHSFLPQAECDYSGRTGEAVEISTDDGTIQHAVISLAQLGKLLRFRHRQEERRTGNQDTAAARQSPRGTN